MSDPDLQVAQIIPCTEAEGPGKRFALWFQGCPLRCVECCNPEMLSFNGGTTIPSSDVIQQIQTARATQGIEGITLIGGEPFAHANSAAPIASAARAMNLSVMIFSGYTIEELRSQADPAVAELLQLCDLLVDGRYEKTQPDTSRRWIGSANQKMHFLTDFYASDHPDWNSKDTLEIRWNGDEVLINGFPAADAKSLWKNLIPRRPNESKSD